MQQRDQYQSFEDFLPDPSFRLWVLTGSDPDQWEAWTVDHPQRAKLVEEARIWIMAMQLPDNQPTPSESQMALQITWQKIWLAEESTSRSVWRGSWWRGVAAILLLGVVLGWYFHERTLEPPALSYSKLVKQAPDPLLERTNDTDHPMLITLSEGSSVLLQPKSKLSYPGSFEGNERQVYLSGEGFFEISKNPAKPFLVYANEVVTRVVGTSFRVKAYDDQNDIEVVVRTGKVNVRSNQSVNKAAEEEVLLLPNQGVRFGRRSLAFEKIDDLTQESLISQERSSIEKLSFEFSDVPVAQIFKTIEQAYSIKIYFPKERLENCYLTTSLSDEPLSQKLKIICESLGGNTKYLIEGNRITIESEGCN